MRHENIKTLPEEQALRATLQFIVKDENCKPENHVALIGIVSDCLDHCFRHFDENEVSIVYDYHFFHLLTLFESNFSSLPTLTSEVGLEDTAPFGADWPILEASILNDSSKACRNLKGFLSSVRSDPKWVLKIESISRFIELLKNGNEIFALLNEQEHPFLPTTSLSGLEQRLDMHEPQENKNASDVRKQYQLPGTEIGVLDIDVPGDNSCLFYSVALGYLLPVLRSSRIFGKRYQKLFGGPENNDRVQNLREILQRFDGTPSFINQQGDASIFKSLINDKFRPCVVQYMRNRRNDYKELLAYERTESRTQLITDDEFDLYLGGMAKSQGNWGGMVEMHAMMGMLGSEIIVYIGGGRRGLLQQDVLSSTPSQAIHVLYTNASGNLEGEKNHYHLLLPERDLPSHRMENASSDFRSKQESGEPLSDVKTNESVGTQGDQPNIENRAALLTIQESDQWLAKIGKCFDLLGRLYYYEASTFIIWKKNQFIAQIKRCEGIVTKLFEFILDRDPAKEGVLDCYKGVVSFLESNKSLGTAFHNLQPLSEQTPKVIECLQLSAFVVPSIISLVKKLEDALRISVLSEDLKKQVSKSVKKLKSQVAELSWNIQILFDPDQNPYFMIKTAMDAFLFLRNHNRIEEILRKFPDLLGAKEKLYFERCRAVLGARYLSFFDDLKARFSHSPDTVFANMLVPRLKEFFVDNGSFSVGDRLFAYRIFLAYAENASAFLGDQERCPPKDLLHFLSLKQALKNLKALFPGANNQQVTPAERSRVLSELRLFVDYYKGPFQEKHSNTPVSTTEPLENNTAFLSHCLTPLFYEVGMSEAPGVGSERESFDYVDWLSQLKNDSASNPLKKKENAEIAGWIDAFFDAAKRAKFLADLQAALPKFKTKEDVALLIRHFKSSGRVDCLSMEKNGFLSVLLNPAPFGVDPRVKVATGKIIRRLKEICFAVLEGYFSAKASRQEGVAYLDYKDCKCAFSFLFRLAIFNALPKSEREQIAARLNGVLSEISTKKTPRDEQEQLSTFLLLVELSERFLELLSDMNSAVPSDLQCDALVIQLSGVLRCVRLEESKGNFAKVESWEALKQALRSLQSAQPRWWQEMAWDIRHWVSNGLLTSVAYRSSQLTGYREELSSAYQAILRLLWGHLEQEYRSSPLYYLLQPLFNLTGSDTLPFADMRNSLKTLERWHISRWHLDFLTLVQAIGSNANDQAQIALKTFLQKVVAYGGSRSIENSVSKFITPLSTLNWAAPTTTLIKELKNKVPKLLDWHERYLPVPLERLRARLWSCYIKIMDWDKSFKESGKLVEEALELLASKLERKLRELIQKIERGESGEDITVCYLKLKELETDYVFGGMEPANEWFQQVHNAFTEWKSTKIFLPLQKKSLYSHMLLQFKLEHMKASLSLSGVSLKSSDLFKDIENVLKGTNGFVLLAGLFATIVSVPVVAGILSVAALSSVLEALISMSYARTSMETVFKHTGLQSLLNHFPEVCLGVTHYSQEDQLKHFFHCFPDILSAEKRIERIVEHFLQAYSDPISVLTKASQTLLVDQVLLLLFAYMKQNFLTQGAREQDSIFVQELLAWVAYASLEELKIEGFDKETVLERFDGTHVTLQSVLQEAALLCHIKGGGYFRCRYGEKQSMENRCRWPLQGEVEVINQHVASLCGSGQPVIPNGGGDPVVVFYGDDVSNLYDGKLLEVPEVNWQPPRKQEREIRILQKKLKAVELKQEGFKDCLQEVKELIAKISFLSPELKAVNEGSKTFTDVLYACKKALSDWGGRMTALEGEVASLKGEVVSLQGEVDLLKKENGEKETKIEALNERLQKLEQGAAPSAAKNQQGFWTARNDSTSSCSSSEADGSNPSPGDRQ